MESSNYSVISFQHQDKSAKEESTRQIPQKSWRLVFIIQPSVAKEYTGQVGSLGVDLEKACISGIEIHYSEFWKRLGSTKLVRCLVWMKQSSMTLNWIVSIQSQG